MSTAPTREHQNEGPKAPENSKKTLRFNKNQPKKSTTPENPEKKGLRAQFSGKYLFLVDFGAPKGGQKGPKPTTPNEPERLKATRPNAPEHFFESFLI